MKLLLKDLLNMGEARLKKGNCPTPRLDAELLFYHMLGKDKSWLFLHYGDEVDDKICEEYFMLIDSRAEGTPLQHITGSQEFMGLNFQVNKKVLIPRQDTEILVEKALGMVKEKRAFKRRVRILDLCCGSGAIAISLAYHLCNQNIKAFLFASDVSPDAISIARNNSVLNKVDRHIRFIEGDLFKPFPKDRRGKGKQQFDFILSNPPYIPSGVIPTLMREIKDHEPIIALDGGADGLDFHKRILKEAHSYLVKGGVLALEIGYDQGDSLKFLADDVKAYGNVEILKDFSGNDRLAILKLVG